MTPPHHTSSLLVAPGVRHGFFGRRGGVSSGIYESLNAGPGSQDDPEDVAENRARIAAAMKVAPDRLLSLHQIHSARALRVDAPWSGSRPEADALVTATPGLALSALAADCAPVLMVDEAAGVIGAAHAGWRGALGGVLEACVAAMTDAGARPERIRAAVGPCIHQHSYEVGPEFRDAFANDDAMVERFFRPGAGDRLQFDLPGYCLDRLARAGVTQAEALPLDTYAESDTFHSHRRHVHMKRDDYGRNCSAIVLEG
ncbi:MAG: peptidoglycan editing factor PgeF [Hyphomonadaceae bacterium]|nr:peptidoglycan editing factor PgeF [Hyphomonadaceae bacterium]